MAHQWSNSEYPGWSTTGVSDYSIRIFLRMSRQEVTNDNKLIAEAVLYARKIKDQVNFFTADACQYLSACQYQKELVVTYYNETNK